MTGARFPRRARLLNKREFSYVFEQPEKSGDANFTVLARRNGLDSPRLGMAISRKVAKLSVQRNRLKRLIRESFRHQQHWLGGIDFVVMGRMGVVERDNPQLLAALERHWKRLNHRCATC